MDKTLCTNALPLASSHHGESPFGLPSPDAHQTADDQPQSELQDPKQQRRVIGRPMKYRPFIEALEDDVVYTPASIIDWGYEKGVLLKEPGSKEGRSQRVKVRHSLARFSKNHGFPDEGDGVIRRKGQQPARGWKGSRWKASLRKVEPGTPNHTKPSEEPLPTASVNKTPVCIPAIV
ncbi:hypothetical protein SCOR_27300 [Sulfidibacter corallicola]|uniref:Uncharacterized protein n=1 Tax=Sulfidibacter corallicola TaxID=2818388 RepID=A0A8A4TL62_SULCO|nr:hypothetical protein [Sulfidibacter corallicola]QTD50739.1 hypothetical protein J3U87_34570 [Sulfidibacter corallicola]